MDIFRHGGRLGSYPPPSPTPLPFLKGSVLLIVLFFCVVFFVLFGVLKMSCVPNVISFSVSLDCIFLIAPSVFSNVYLDYMITNKIHVYLFENLKYFLVTIFFVLLKKNS